MFPFVRMNAVRSELVEPQRIVSPPEVVWRPACKKVQYEKMIGNPFPPGAVKNQPTAFETFTPLGYAPWLPKEMDISFKISNE